MRFEEKLRQYTDSINKALDELSAVPDNLQREVYEAMRYSLMAGGKRIRPVLTLAVCDMLGGCEEDALLFGTAIECIHTYSLIHDDLPCMDNDELRRGKPTCHKKFGESTALLAGDGLLTYAFGRMADLESYHRVSHTDALRLIAEASRYAGCDGMIGGQVVDLACEGRDDVGIDTLVYMHRRKTGALIHLAAEAGAYAAGADSAELKKIGEYADGIGLAFQIKDDILDFTSSTETLGKPVGSDSENGKTTYVTHYGIEGARKKLDEATDYAIESIKYFGEKAGFLIELAEYLINRKN